MSEDTRNDAPDRRGRQPRGPRMREGTGRSASRIPSGRTSGARPCCTTCRQRSSSARRFWRSRATRKARYRAPLPRTLAPLIERMFRYTWFLATEKRDAMVREGREDELDALVAEARTLHESLRRGGTG